MIGRKVKLGENHPEVLDCMYNLALTTRELGRFADARDLLQDCVGRQKEILGPDNIYTMRSSHTFGWWETERIRLRMIMYANSV